MSAISKTTDRVVIAIDPHKASWTTIGLFEGNVLGGGVGGARHRFAGVGAETGQIELGTPSRDPEVVEKLIDDIEATYGVGGATYDRLVAKRDRRTIAVLDALKNSP